MTPDSTSGAPGVVVVTGVSRYLGAHVAARLAADPRIERVIGVDVPEPGAEFSDLLDRVERIRVDSGSLGGLLADLDVDAVVHLALVSAPDPQHGGRSGMKDQNVIGTMHLLAACQRAPRLRKLVVRSSTAAYGVSFRDPAVFTEETEPREVPRGGFGRDILDVEGYVRGFRRRRADVTATVLRFAPFIGSTADTTLTRYFSQPFVPTVFGRDPRLQFLHFDDALEVLHRSIVEDHPGTYNVAGPGVLSLTQAIRRAGRVAVPVLEPGLSGAAALARSMGFGRYGWTRSTSSCTAGSSTRPASSRSTASRPAPPPRRSTTSSAPTTAGWCSVGASWPPPSNVSWTASARSAPRCGSGNRDRAGEGREPAGVGRFDVPSGPTVPDAEPARRNGHRPTSQLAPASTPADEVDTAATDEPPAESGPATAGGPAVETTGPAVPDRPGDHWDRRVANGLAFLRRRLSGDYEVDEFGFDPELTDAIFHPLLRLLYRDWFRTEVSGVEHVPVDGPATVVGNHSGTVALDALILSAALHDKHPAHRYLRLLGADLVFRMPVVSEIARKTGGTVACNPDAERLLGGGDLVGVFPEGFKGVGKLYADRYKLQRFGRGGFVSAALRTGTPIVPVAIVGGEEIYPMLADIKPWLGCSSCRIFRSRRPFPGSGRWAWCRCPANG